MKKKSEKVDLSLSPMKLFDDKIQKFRKNEFKKLESDGKKVIYLDSAGSPLCGSTPVRNYAEDLNRNIYGNPHSSNQSSSLTADVVENIRSRVLQYFKASCDEFSVVFTSGCTASLKIIADCFDFQLRSSTTQGKNVTQLHLCKDDHSYKGQSIQHDVKPALDDQPNKNHTKLKDENNGLFCFLEDSHTSLVGMREVIRDRFNHCICLGQEQVDYLCEIATHPGKYPLCLCSHLNHKTDTDFDVENFKCQTAESQAEAGSLFLYSLQSNFNGRKYPLSWISASDHLFCQGGKWYVGLDAASFVSTSHLDLSVLKPDFVAVSFYKIFGFPTGLGALIVKKSAEERLLKTYFGGGTIDVAIPRADFHRKRKDFSERFEDGTLPFLEIIALGHSMDFLESSIGDMDQISTHTFGLAKFIFQQLSVLMHDSGYPMVILYHNNNFENIIDQGPILNFNILKPDGSIVGFSEVDKIAQLFDIQMRTGCFCNTGACQIYLDMDTKQVKSMFEAGHVCGDTIDVIDGKPTGSCRISFGYYSTMGDAVRFLQFIVDNFQISNAKKNYLLDLESVINDCFKTVSDNNADNVTRSENGSMKHLTDGEEKTTLKDACTVKSKTPAVQSLRGEIFISSQSATLKNICIYPVKSCGAFQVKSWECGSRGLLFDRHWMVVNEKGICVSQKRLTKLCMIKTKVDTQKELLILSYPGHEDVSVSLCQGNSKLINGEQRNPGCLSRVCSDRVSVLDCGETVAVWLQTVLDQPGLRLIQQDPTSHRVSKTHPTPSESAGRLSLANQSQYLLINKRSCQHIFPERGSVDALLNGRDRLEHGRTLQNLPHQSHCLQKSQGSLQTNQFSCVVKWSGSSRARQNVTKPTSPISLPSEITRCSSGFY